MSNEYFKNIAEAWRQIAEKKTLDPVDPKALKGKHSDRKDKDLDNDGDVDKSDEYLHNRRKAVSKAMKNESEDEMKPCPKCDGSMQNHDPDCPMADKDDDDDDDMKDESSCGKKMKKESVEQVDEAVNVKAIQKAVDNGKSMDVIVGMFANKRTTNTDEIRKVVKDYMWKKRIKKESVSHEKWGYGEVIETTEEGVNVYFEHGVEFNVPFEDLTMIGEAKKMKGDDPCWKDYEMVGKKMKNGKEVPNCVPKKESVEEVEEQIQTTYSAVQQNAVDFMKRMWENKQTKGATKPEGIMDKESPNSKAFAKQHDADNPEMVADDEKGHVDATKAGRAVGKQAPTRGGEKRIGDKSIVNPVKGAVTKTTGKE